MYKYLFGPVPSRRLGMSLGVDLVPHKVCSLDCVYCECGLTTKLTLDRMEYILFQKVTEELLHYFSNNPNPDYITFSGSGEPTLNSKIGEVLRFIKKFKPDIPVAVLTNGTLLNNIAVREEIMQADLVLPSLDAATESAFKKVNRPAPGLTVENYISGLADFRKEYPGKIWLEILFIPGFNDDPENLEALKEAIRSIQPDKIQLNTLDRPGVLDDLHPAPVSWLRNIAKEWGLPNVELIAAPASRKKIKAFRQDTETAILETIYRRPCTAKDLADILGLHLNEVNKYLDVLEAENKVEVKRGERGIFYQLRK
ncbi:MAG: radical SAM protein [Bacteroidales bacterium]|nr:radical SAM protein [Bacteroidales bacterium]